MKVRVEGRILIISDLHIGNTIDAWALRQFIKALKAFKDKITTLLILGDVNDFFRIYESQKNFAYETQPLIAAEFIAEIAEMVGAEKVIILMGNHDERHLGREGLHARLTYIVKKLIRGEVVSRYDDLIIEQGRRLILATHGDEFRGGRGGLTPMLATQIIAKAYRYWREGVPVDTIVVGHFHAFDTIRKVEGEGQLEMILLPALKHEHTYRGNIVGGVVLGPGGPGDTEFINIAYDPQKVTEAESVLFNGIMLDNLDKRLKNEEVPPLDETMEEILKKAKNLKRLLRW